MNPALVEHSLSTMFVVSRAFPESMSREGPTFAESTLEPKKCQLDVLQECGFKRKTFQAELGFSIQVTECVRSIKDGLQRYFTEEIMTGKNRWDCPKCKVKVDCRNSWYLETAPNTLIMSLKRFDPHKLTKITRQLPYPLRLSLDDYMVCPWGRLQRTGLHSEQVAPWAWAWAPRHNHAFAGAIMFGCL
jgi:hypothetical protein